MPNIALPGWSPKAVRQRSAQRRDRRIAPSTALSGAGRRTHSSSCIWMSEPRSPWISIERSGVSTCFVPSTCDRKVTPVSSSLRSDDSDMTWKPPESVRIGYGHCMKACRPPSRAIRSAPGRSIRW